MKKMQITEEMKLHEQWYKDASKQTISTVTNFMEHILNDYQHDYGTICHAIAACGLAAMWAANSHPSAGISGFQSSAIMWQIIREWGHYESPLKLVDFNEMLYPQYEKDFQKNIRLDAFKLLQEQAKKLLLEDKVRTGGASETVKKHWQSIIDGEVPFGYEINEN